MATTKELIYDIKEYLKKYSDDNEYSNRYIQYLWNNKRSKYLRQLLNDRTRKFDNIILQTLCMELEIANAGSCGINYPCFILRTKEVLPKLLEVRSRDTLVKVSPTDFTSKPFKIIKLDEVPYIFHKPYSNSIYVFYNNDDEKLYIISKNDIHKLLECITVTGIFNSPEQLYYFKNCCGNGCDEPCFTEDMEYPMQSFLIDPIRAEILEQIIPRENISEDDINNSDAK